MIKESLTFNYAGIDSSDMHIINVSVNGGNLYEEPFIATKTIIEKKVKGKNKPYFNRIEQEPLIFNLHLAFEKVWNSDEIRKVARWLTGHKIYQPLRFSDNPNIIYYALVVEESNLIHNGLKKGYINITFRCDSSYGYLDTEIIDWIDLSNNSLQGTDILLNNNGDEVICPTIWIQKIGVGEISILNKVNDTLVNFKQSQKASSSLKIISSLYQNEKIIIGDEEYIVNIKNSIPSQDTNPFTIDIDDGNFATNVLWLSGYVKAGETITIGNDIYQFDNDKTNVMLPNIFVDISDYVSYARGELVLKSNPIAQDRITIGNVTYTFDLATNENILKIPNHGIDNTAGQGYIINRDRGNEIRKVNAIDRNYLELESKIDGQRIGDMIEVYQEKYEGLVKNKESGYTSQIITDDTQGLRNGDVIKINDEYIKIASVQRDTSITLVANIYISNYDRFYGLNRIRLSQADGVGLENVGTVSIGADILETLENLQNAINMEANVGKGIDYSHNNTINPLVFAEIDSSDNEKLILTSKFVGTEGNKININSKFKDPENKFMSDMLIGGKDCFYINAKNAFITTFNESKTEKVIITNSDNNIISFKYEYAGTVGNGIITLTTCKGLQWNKDSFTGGTDCSTISCIDALVNAINLKSQLVSANVSNNSSNTIIIEYKELGRKGNISVKSECLNLFFDNDSLYDGIDGLMDGELIFIDGEGESLYSSADENHRYDCFNQEYLELELGENIINIKGNCKIKFEIVSKVIQG